MKVKLACGTDLVSFRVPDGQAGLEVVGPVIPVGYARGRRGPGPDAIAERIRRPISGPPLADLVRPGPVVILVDDFTRPTPAGLLAVPVLAELAAAGANPGDIVFLGATGSHRPMSPRDFEAKLGSVITSSYRCVSHDFAGPLACLGRTGRGTPVEVNPLVAEAAVLIGLGAVYPHGEVGWSGGGKIAVPGAAGLATMTHNHVTIGSAAVTHEDAYRGDQRLDLDEAAEMAGLGFIANAVLSPEGEIVEVFAGAPGPAHAAAVLFAADYFKPGGPGVAGDVLPGAFEAVLAGCGPFDNDIYQADRGLGVAGRLCREGGVILWVAGCVEGQGRHGVLEQTDWRETRWESLERLSERATIILCAPGLTQKEACQLLPPGITFCRAPEEASRLFEGALQRARGAWGTGSVARIAHLPWASVLNC